MNDEKFLGLFLIAVAIVLAGCFIGLGLRNGIARGAAMSTGMSPQQYSDWMDLVR